MRRTLRWTMALVLPTTLLSGCGAIEANTRPVCRYNPPTLLMAQSVPGAALVPCVRALPIGWHFHGFDARNGSSQFWLDSDIAGGRALDVVLTRGCDVAGATPARSDEPGTRLYRRILRPAPLSAEWFYRFAGGCVTYRFSFQTRARAELLTQVARGLSFLRVSVLDAGMRRRFGRPLEANR
jgi:hypothetical protein